MLKEKVALITGASGGIGRAVAIKLAENGATVIVHYNGNKEKAEETVKYIEYLGGKAILKKADVSDSESCKEMVEEIIKEFGKIDILVNNAGITKDGLFIKMSERDFDEVIDINLKGSFNCSKFASRYMMKKRSGNIINMASISGIIGNAGQVNYSASKAGLIGMTKALAKELSARNIRVNAIAPGFIETEMTEKLSEKIREEAVKQIPLGRFGKAEEVANVALFLASEQSGYITGQVIRIDGGIVI
ncbi:MAG: 3-oxoacyl-[acyl-carrier-protein] reductase [Peptostreptococcaceae bacterium]|nr:3-oxoacyl-[acyl-carrier-protein] reductase [Peptostreptococcaceae bacterium]